MHDEGFEFETLVLGVGNVLWADEGFGVRCAEFLDAHYELSPSVRVMDGGTQGLYLLPYVQQARRLLIFDAIDYGLPPGTLRLIENQDVPRFMGAKKMSLHQTGFQDVLCAAELTGRCPTEMLLIGVQPEEIDDYGGSLRPIVREKIEVSVALGACRLRRWGHEVRQRSEAAATDLTAPALDLAAYESGRPSPEEACRVGDERVLRSVRRAVG
ncbi:MAG TPA: HyaD/HybD family hydrogenase maturation endopeptidase [Steroidobacteraceae bacterium]